MTYEELTSNLKWLTFHDHKVEEKTDRNHNLIKQHDEEFSKYFKLKLKQQKLTEKLQENSG